MCLLSRGECAYYLATSCSRYGCYWPLMVDSIHSLPATAVVVSGYVGPDLGLYNMLAPPRNAPTVVGICHPSRHVLANLGAAINNR